MTATSLAPLTRHAAEALASELAGEMTRRWRTGERPPVEEFLAQHPDLWQYPEAAADLIYEELCLREEYGPGVSIEEVLERFPQWRPQVELLLDCQRLLGPRRPGPQFPSTGESLGDFLLLAELGRGVHGRVFLANQLSLGDRPVVIKLTPCDASEHLSLARLQHTHIVPLYCVQDHAARGLRALCMPYFGGSTLARVLDALRAYPPANRTGADLFAALDRLPSPEPLIAPARLAQRPPVATTSYAHAVAWLGACLADALQYAHDRGLVHLDLKPSNVLVTADGQPMVLDFHLAREPVLPTDVGPAWLGGTPGYMSPEQTEALLAVREAKPVPRPVDGRSDIYSLGVVLYEALAGGLPWPNFDLQAVTTVKADDGEYPPPAPTTQSPAPLSVRNPQVSIGLSDIVAKCLAADPAKRYQTMAALAIDLRRHLSDLPLLGVRNRSFSERWHKWRRRRPHGVALTGMMGAVVAAMCAVIFGAVSHVSDRIEHGKAALTDGRIQAAKNEWDAATVTARRGLSAVQGLPFQGELTGDLERLLSRADEGRAAADRTAGAAELHRLADRTRFLYGAEKLPDAGRAALAAGCQTFWDDRHRVVERLSPLNPTMRADLYDIAICWADLSGEPLAVLYQAEALLGPTPVLDQERRLHGGKVESSAITPASAWDHYALGRAFLRSGDVDRAAAEVEQAIRLEPQGLWPNFYFGVCGYRRGHFVDAVTAFGVCIGAAPDKAGCYYNRALAFTALGERDAAARDYEQAQRLDANLKMRDLALPSSP
jgi:serine/threonine protein kinase